MSWRMSLRDLDDFATVFGRVLWGVDLGAVFGDVFQVLQGGYLWGVLWVCLCGRSGLMFWGCSGDARVVFWEHVFECLWG